MTPHCGLDLEGKKTTTKNLGSWLMMLHHHTKFGNKMFCDSENIIRTFPDILNLLCDLDLEFMIQFLPQDTLAFDAYYQTTFGRKPTSSLEDTTEIVIF